MSSARRSWHNGGVSRPTTPGRGSTDEGRYLLRQIGDLPQNLDPKVFEDHLLSLGIKSRFDRRPDGWAVWIYDEDHVDQARQELDDFLSRPDDPRFLESAPAAAARRRREKELDRQFRKNDRDVASAWSGLQARRRPATIAIIAIAVVVFGLQQSRRFDLADDRLPRLLLMDSRRPRCSSPACADGRRQRSGLAADHADLSAFHLLHIFFNVWWTSVLGTAIERQRGTWRLVVLVLVTAVVSNLTEFGYMEWFLRDAHMFGGLSGVVYALFGYVWMKGENEPEQGLGIDSRNTMIMLVWLFICMTGWVGPVANAAHVGGLVAGVDARAAPILIVDDSCRRLRYLGTVASWIAHRLRVQWAFDHHVRPSTGTRIEMTMKLGFVSAILPEYSLEQVLEFASRAGFASVELMCWPPGKAERRYAGVTPPRRHRPVARRGQEDSRPARKAPGRHLRARLLSQPARGRPRRSPRPPPPI